MLSVVSARSASVTLEWDPSPDANVVGYNIYYGPSMGTYTNVVPIGNFTNGTLQGLITGGTYYFAATALADNGLESEFSNEIAYTIPANPGNMPPTLAALSNLVINEGAAQQTVQLSGISSGATNEAQTLTITATSSNPALIPNPAVTYRSPDSTGTLTFAPVPFAYGSASITVTVNDGGASNNVVSRTFNVTVNSVNQAPTLAALSDIIIAESAPQQTVTLSGITSGASNEVQTLTVTAASSNPALIPTPTVTYSSPNTTGTLRFTPVLYANGTAIITVTVKDGGASNNVVSQSFTVTVTPVNQAPTLAALGDLVINESAPQQTVVLSGIGSGATNENQTLTVSAISSNPALIPTPAVTYASPGATGSLKFTPVPFGYGMATITVTVNDGGAENSVTSQSFKVTVLSVNQAPTLDSLADVVVNQGSGQQTIALSGIGSGATNENQTLTVAATSSNAALIPTPTVVYSSPASTGSLQFTPSSSTGGIATLTVTVNDGGASNNVVSRSFKVTVNQLPTISSIGNTLIAAGSSTAAIPFTIGDAETSAANLSLTKASSNVALVPESNIVLGGTGANRTVKVTPTAGATGFSMITIRVSDGTATASTTFKVTVEVKPGAPGNFRIALEG